MQMSLLAVTHLCYAQTPEPSMAPQHLQNQVKIPLKTPSDSSLHPPPFSCSGLGSLCSFH